MKGNSLQVKKITNLMSNIKSESSWKAIPWMSLRQKLCLIQGQIFNYVKCRNFKKALFLQKFLFFTTDIYYLAIKEITQLRLDRKISGIDRYVISGASHRFSLACFIQKQIFCWISKPVRRIYLVDFLKGKILIFIPTVSDRIVQYIWGLILEPVFNALFFKYPLHLCSLYKCLFAKYTVVLKLLSCLECIKLQILHLKCSFFSYFISKLNITYLLKSIFFPETSKDLLFSSFRLLNNMKLNFSNDNLYFYLYKFHYILVSFVVFGLNQICFRLLYLKFPSFLIQFNFCYFTEIIYAFDFYKLKYSSVYKYFLQEISFEHVLFSKFLTLSMKNPVLGFAFLDWHFKLLSPQVCKISFCYSSWFDYKFNFKKILTCTKYNIYQRIKLLEIFVESIGFLNWMCMSAVFRWHFYILRILLNRYFKRNIFILKCQNLFILKKVFS